MGKTIRLAILILHVVGRERLAANNGALAPKMENLRDEFERAGIERSGKSASSSCQPVGSAYNASLYYARLGDRDKSLESLQRAREPHEFDSVFFFAEPPLRQFVEDSRYLDLANRMLNRK